MSTIDPLEHALEEALDGDRAQVEQFFRVLLRSSLTVPKRFQHLPLSDSPQYPNEFLDILGIKDKDRTVVPVFSRAELVKEWSGTEFLSRQLSLAELINLLPEEWWVVINPGSDIEKELTPWELSQLKVGEQGIPILIEENSAFEADRGMSFLPAPAEFSKVERDLAAFAATRSSIQGLYLLLRDRGDSEGLPALVVGVRSELRSSTELDTLRAELLAVAERAVIGAATMQVMMGGAIGGSMMDGVFSSFTPFYQSKKTGLLHSLRQLLSKKSQ